MPRTAHYVASTHWDREWYEPLQGFRMRLVSLLDEVLKTLDVDAADKAKFREELKQLAEDIRAGRRRLDDAD